jgi:hypothetical protein
MEVVHKRKRRLLSKHELINQETVLGQSFSCYHDHQILCRDRMNVLAVS